MHKGWADRVLAYYVAYGGKNSYHEHNLKGRSWLTVTTTGGGDNIYKKDGFAGDSVEGFLKHFD